MKIGTEVAQELGMSYSTFCRLKTRKDWPLPRHFRRRNIPSLITYTDADIAALKAWRATYPVRKYRMID